MQQKFCPIWLEKPKMTRNKYEMEIIYENHHIPYKENACGNR